jgi:ureidoacrylate peracid hydrolase
MTLVTIDAEPEPLRIDPARTAVIVVDMQNDFGHEQGMFSRRGIDIVPIRQAIGPTRAVLATARNAGAKVVYLKMEFDRDLSNAGLPDFPNRIKHRSLQIGERMTAPDGTEGRILVIDTWNTQILDELRPEPEDLIVSKHRYSGFYGTDLDEKLRRLGITYLVFTGCTTSVCVESTMRDAMFRDYYCLLLADCTAECIGAGLARSNHDASLLVLQTQFGWVSESAKFIEALEEQRVPSAP